MFTICTNNYIAKVLVFNVLNAYKAEDVSVLYEKVSKQVETDEIRLWCRALSAYTPVTKAEKTIYDALMKEADYEMDELALAEYLKWETYAHMN